MKYIILEFIVRKIVGSGLLDEVMKTVLRLISSKMTGEEKKNVAFSEGMKIEGATKKAINFAIEAAVYILESKSKDSSKAK